MKTRHPIHDVFVLAAADAETSGLTSGEVREILTTLLPSFRDDLDAILDSGGLVYRAEARAEKPTPEEAAPQSFSDQIRAELQGMVAKNRVAVPES